MQSSVETTEDEGVATRATVGRDIHPYHDLLSLDAGTLFARLIAEQRANLERLSQTPAVLSLLDSSGHSGDAAQLARFLADIHAHTVSHPVWMHPIFVRIFDGEIDLSQAQRFAAAYFPHIENTRQCIARVLGRLHSESFATITGDDRVNEFVQIVLADMLADEYGLQRPGEGSDANVLLSARTHVAVYRQFLDGLNVPAAMRHAPVLRCVRRHVELQREVAGRDHFTLIEALGSVGLTMEWGVPIFFSLLIAGFLRMARRTGMALGGRDLEMFTSHVTLDAWHAASIALATFLVIRGEADIARLRATANSLMASRYDMMSDIYAETFGGRCAYWTDEARDPAYAASDALARSLAA